jgi:DNA invertase Pin-like site-specific DNA recombinase
MKRALGLIRVSTNAQDVKRQRTDLEKLKKQYGLEIVRILELHGVSGTTTLTNQQVQQVLREVAEHGIDGLACSAIDRLARPQLGCHYAILDGLVMARKTVYTIDDGELKMGTGEGFERAMNALTRAGIELRKIRERCMDGKAEKRVEGRCANGNHTVPDGLHFDAASGLWSYTEPEYSRVARAYEYLFQDRFSLSEIERRVGWGLRRIRTLRNPVWKGLRSYPASEDRDAIEVALPLAPPLKPLLTPSQWDRAQALILKRRTWSKATSDPRFLGAALLVCTCGRLYYFHSDTRRGYHDAYFCASQSPKGRGCGARRLRRDIVDAAIVRIVEEYMTDAKFLAAVLRRVKETPQQDTRAEREKELAKLAARRKKWIEQYDEDRINKAEFEQKMDAVTKAVRQIEATMPAAPPPAVLRPD